MVAVAVMLQRSACTSGSQPATRCTAGSGAAGHTVAQSIDRKSNRSPVAVAVTVLLADGEASVGDVHVVHDFAQEAFPSVWSVKGRSAGMSHFETRCSSREGVLYRSQSVDAQG